MRLALFAPCFNDAFFPETLRATVLLLERLGHEVSLPEGQTCCGQIHFNTGYRHEALRLMKRFLRIFEQADRVVAPSASCVAMVREQYQELAAGSGDAGLQRAVAEVASRTREVSELLVGELGVEDVGAVFPYRVAYHPTCHSTRSIRVGDAPLCLLRSVRGLELVDLPDAHECCGFGGTFAVKNPDTSLAMMEDKLRRVRESGAQVLTAVDNSCLLHLAGGMRRRGWLAEGRGEPRGRAAPTPPAEGNGRIRVLHLVEILASEREP